MGLAICDLQPQIRLKRFILRAFNPPEMEKTMPFEVMKVNDRMRELIVTRPPTSARKSSSAILSVVVHNNTDDAVVPRDASEILREQRLVYQALSGHPIAGAVAAELAEVSERARDKKLSPRDIQGGCISISSLGGIGGTAFTPIINAPEVAILGVSRSSMKPVWDGHEFQPRLMLPLSLSYDHRVIDGAAAARFTRFLASRLEDLRRLTL